MSTHSLRWSPAVPTEEGDYWYRTAWMCRMSGPHDVVTGADAILINEGLYT